MTSQPLPKRFQTQVEISRGHIMTLRGVIALMAVLCAGLWYGWMTAPSSMTVHIPPDLRSGSEQLTGEIPAQNVYVFAAYIWQQMHRWPKNGEKDYAANIHRLQSYITPRFYDWLEDDFQAKTAKGELRRKIRGVAEIPGHNYEPERVAVLGDGAWLVWLDFEIKEWVNDLNTKTVTIRYESIPFYGESVLAGIDVGHFVSELICFAMSESRRSGRYRSCILRFIFGRLTIKEA